MLTPLPSATTEDLDPTNREATARDPRAVRIFAKTIYRELRQSGLNEEGVMALAGELLSLLASDVSDRRRDQDSRLGPTAHGANSVRPRANAEADGAR